MLSGRVCFPRNKFRNIFSNCLIIFRVLTYISVSGGVPLFLFSDWRPEEAEEDVFLKISTTFVIFVYKQTKLGTAPSWKSRKIGRTSTFFDKFQPHFVINSSAKILVLNQFDHPWFNLSIFWRYCEILPVTMKLLKCRSVTRYANARSSVNNARSSVNNARSSVMPY